MSRDRSFYDEYESTIKKNEITDKAKLDTIPIEYRSVYGDQERLVGPLKFNKFIVQKLFTEERMQCIIQFKNQSNFSFILKRGIIIYYPKKDQLSANEFEQNYHKFVSDSHKEYIISQLSSAHPSVIKPFDFQISRIIKNDSITIITEFLMEYGGDPFQKQIQLFEKNIDKIMECFLSIIKVMKFLEKNQVAYSDLKLENLVINTFNHQIKILDFDISQSKSIQNTTQYLGIKTIYGYTKGYVSPEIYINHKSKNSCKSEERGDDRRQINCGKSDVYSFGILGLILLGTLKNENLDLIDIHKDEEEKHNIMIKGFIDNIKIESRKMLEVNLKYILRMCLEFNPQKRIDFRTLYKILENNSLENKSEIEFKGHVLCIMLENFNLEKGKTLEKLQNIGEELILLNKSCSEIQSEICKEINRIKEVNNFSLKGNTQLGNNSQIKVNQNLLQNQLGSNFSNRFCKSEL